MKKRGLIIGAYSTASLWTLSAWALSSPEQFTKYLDVPGRSKGPLDLSTVLTDDEPTYLSRELTATLECSEGTRLERKKWIAEMVNELDGGRWEIVFPDDPHRFAVGRVRVKPIYNDMAHAAVSVSAVCEPWLYNRAETVVVLTATSAKQVVTLKNSGRLSLVPTVVVEGSGANVLIELDGVSYALSEGTFDTLSRLYLRPGDTPLTYSGGGTVCIKYREAVLE